MKIKPTPETIWKRPAYLPYVHPPLTDKVIFQAEKQLGCNLPGDFLEVLQVQNGGPIRFRIPDCFGDTIAGIGPTFPSITDFNWTDDQEYVDFQLEGLVPFDGDGHWYYCLDFREDPGNPSVTRIDIDWNTQEQIADSFSNFLQLMELDLEHELVLTNVESLDDARKKLQAIFGSSFEPKVSNLGVPYLKCKVGKEWDDCFWISNNKVAAGYSGKDPDSFHYEGEALLFPELSSTTVIFEAPENRIQSYRDRLCETELELVTIEDAQPESGNSSSPS